MSTVLTQALPANRYTDLVNIKQEIDDYSPQALSLGKFGYIKLVLTGYSWAGGDGTSDIGLLDIRVPNHNDLNNDIYLNQANIGTAATGSVSLSKTYIYAINNGNFPPSCFMQPDGTVDLMRMTYTKSVANNVIFTLTYTLTYVDVTMPPAGAITYTQLLTSSLQQTLNAALISDLAATYAGLNGYMAITLDNMIITSQLGNLPDTPYFSLTALGGTQRSLATHALMKGSGTKKYYKIYWIFGVTNGKIDGNGSLVAVSNTNHFAFANATLRQITPCADVISALIGIHMNWVAIA